MAWSAGSLLQQQDSVAGTRAQRGAERQAAGATALSLSGLAGELRCRVGGRCGVWRTDEKVLLLPGL